jgi:hypothetical protein
MESCHRGKNVELSVPGARKRMGHSLVAFNYATEESAELQRMKKKHHEELPATGIFRISLHSPGQSCLTTLE